MRYHRPYPSWASGVGRGGRGKGREAAAAGISGSLNCPVLSVLSCPVAALKRLQEAAAKIHNVLPNFRPLIQLSAGQTSQIFLCECM